MGQSHELADGCATRLIHRGDDLSHLFPGRVVHGKFFSFGIPSGAPTFSVLALWEDAFTEGNVNVTDRFVQY